MNTPIVDTPKNKAVMNIYLTGIFTALTAQVQNPKSISDEELLAIIQRLFTQWYWPEITKQEGRE